MFVPSREQMTVDYRNSIVLLGVWGVWEGGGGLKAGSEIFGFSINWTHQIKLISFDPLDLDVSFFSAIFLFAVS